MEAEQRSFIEWLKVHKTELILAGVGIPLIILMQVVVLFYVLNIG